MILADEYNDGWWTSVTGANQIKNFNFFFSMYGSISISVGLETFEIFDLFSQVELQLRDQNRQLNYFGSISCMCDE